MRKLIISPLQSTCSLWSYPWKQGGKHMIGRYTAHTNWSYLNWNAFDLIPTKSSTATRGWKKFWNIYCGVQSICSLWSNDLKHEREIYITSIICLQSTSNFDSSVKAVTIIQFECTLNRETTSKMNFLPHGFRKQLYNCILSIYRYLVCLSM